MPSPSRMGPAGERPSLLQPQPQPVRSSIIKAGTVSPRPSSPQPRPVLGGELVVRVVCAKVGLPVHAFMSAVAQSPGESDPAAMAVLIAFVSQVSEVPACQRKLRVLMHSWMGWVAGIGIQ